MNKYYSKVKNYLLELEMSIKKEDEEKGVFVIENQDDGIVDMVVYVSEPLVVIEQVLFKIKDDSAEVLKKLLMKNRDIIHGAMVLDDSGKVVIFRDTLEVETLDLQELGSSIEALSLLLSEFGKDILTFVE